LSGHQIFPFGEKNCNESQIEIGRCSWGFIIFIFHRECLGFGIQAWSHAHKWWITKSKTTITSEIVDKIHDMVLADRRIKMREIKEGVSISYNW